MKIPHFFKAKSRLGLKNAPQGSVDLNTGVEDAPEAILTDEFLSNFGNYTISEYVFPKPEEIAASSYFNVLAQTLEDFCALIGDKLKVNETQVVIGGDDSVTFSSLLAVLERVKYPKNLGYLRFDSHGDMNLLKSSPTKNFHGMYHRPLLSDFDIPQIKKIARTKLIPQNLLFIGNLNLDPEEGRFFRKIGIRNINKERLKGQKKKVFREIKKFILSYPFLHVSFDIDALDFKVAPATGIPAQNGLTLNEVLPLLEMVSTHPNCSFDLVEVNPKKMGAQKTIRVARKILRTLGS